MGGLEDGEGIGRESAGSLASEDGEGLEVAVSEGAMPAGAEATGANGVEEAEGARFDPGSTGRGEEALGGRDDGLGARAGGGGGDAISGGDDDGEAAADDGEAAASDGDGSVRDGEGGIGDGEGGGGIGDDDGGGSRSTSTGRRSSSRLLLLGVGERHPSPCRTLGSIART